jgi:Zn-dependent metalloprotease
MTFRRWLLGSLVAVSAGCEPIQEESLEQEKPPAQVQAEKLAEAQGFDLREVSLVEAGNRHELHYQGVPIWGLEAKTANGVTLLTNARFEPATRVETTPRLTQAQAEAAALAELDDATGRVEETRLVLVPREERRRRPDAPTSGRLNAEHFERVVTDLTLIYRVLLTTGEPEDRRGWMARVDARSGRVLRRDSLEVHLDNVYRRVTGSGYYSGTNSMNVLYISTDTPPYWLEDTRGNEFQYAYRASGSSLITYEDYGSTDTLFGNGQLYSRTAGVASANGETAAVDAYYAVNMTWRFYETILGRSGPSGTGKGMVIKVHHPSANASYLAYSSTPSIIVGYGVYPSSSSTWKPLTTTDIIGHELGHDFFMREVAGVPSNFPQGNSELAGMNEGSGDISGVMAEISADTVRAGRSLLEIDWTPHKASHLTIGEQALSTGVRNILNPVYDEWFDGIGDEEEHDAGGPFGRMFMLLAWGCQAIPSGYTATSPWQCRLVPEGFAGAGYLNAARIWSRTVMALPMGADYSQARAAALSATRAMDGTFGGPLLKKVGYAFAAINVGLPPENTPPQILLNCEQGDVDLECGWSIIDAGAPDQAFRQPVLTLDGSQSYTVQGWQNSIIIPGVASGTHTVQLKAWDVWNNEATSTVTVSIDKTPPQASFIRSGLPKQPMFRVSANDPSGIRSVEFHVNGSLMAFMTEPPYEYGFNTSTWADGTYPVVMKVYDRYQNVTTLNHSLAVDNTPPTVALAVDPSGPPFLVTAVVSDASQLLRADFKVDGVVFASYTHSAGVYQVLYTPLDPLAHNLFVEVRDAFGNVNVVGLVAPRDLKLPDVTFNVNQTATIVTLSGSVGDTCGIVYPYSLYVDGTLKAQVSADSYVLDLGTSVAPGQHTFRAVVQDRCGNTANFQTTFTKSASPPVITAILRDDSQPKKPKFTVQCTDTEGVKHVEMRENGVVVQLDTTAPYEFVVDTTSRTDGDYNVLFHCSDIHGVASDPVGRTVTADNTGPSITWFSVYGSGHAYYVLAEASDARGIQSVTLAGGLVGPSFNVTLTAAPYGVQWGIPTTTSIQTDFPFYVTARDRWGNESSLSRWCYVNTSSTQPAYLFCHP